MERIFSFTPAEGPLTIFGTITIGSVYLGQYQVHLRGYSVQGGLTGLDVHHNPCLTVPITLPELEVESWADWKALLADTPGTIHFGEGFEDEELTLEAFIAMVEERASPRTVGRNGNPLSGAYDYITNSKKERHVEWVENHLVWKDAEGYSFTKLPYA